LIGRTIGHRRDAFVLATKCGHVTGDYQGEEWTAETVRDNINRSLRRLKTDRLDLVQLHSCDADVLEQGDVIQALQAAQQAGKTRFIGYSGDNKAAQWAIESGLFDTLQTSFNLVDQSARSNLFGPAKAKNMGIIAKRPIANGAWGASKSPSGYADEYFRRYQKMSAKGPLPGDLENHILLAMGFTYAHDEIDTMIIGTRNPEHMQTNIQWFEERLPIDGAIVEALQRRFEALGEDWEQKG
jgi:aryl-alcohol dehydrogenase-like predicted oxidoreductase